MHKWNVLAILLTAVAGALAATASPPLLGAIDRRLAGYALWMERQFRDMCRVDMSAAHARRIILRSVTGAFMIGVLLGTGLVNRLAGAIACAVFGYVAPWGVVTVMRRRRARVMDDQIIDVLQLMAQGVSAGRNLPLTLELVAEQAEPPIADEFRRLMARLPMNGYRLEEALNELAKRMHNESVDLFVESIVTLRQHGGNLADRFQMIADTLIERKRTLGKIRAVTAAARSQGWMASSIPLALVPLFTLFAPEYMRPLYTTPLGIVLLTAVASLCGTGLWAMLALAEVEP